MRCWSAYPRWRACSIGTWLQQRLNASVISLLFAAILVASAVELVIQ